MLGSSQSWVEDWNAVVPVAISARVTAESQQASPGFMVRRSKSRAIAQKLVTSALQGQIFGRRKRCSPPGPIGQ